MSDDEPLLLRREGGILLMTLNRPDARNAVNLKMAEAIAASIDETESDDDIRAVVITGAGTTFCAGMDLKDFADGRMPVIKGRGFAGIVERPPTKPTIAAVEGWALAGGCEIALSCDMVVAAEDARFGVPEVKRGLIAAGGALARLPKALSYQLAMELALTGDPIGAAEAHRYGLVNRVTPTGESLAEAIRIGQVIAANSPQAVRATKQIIAHVSAWNNREDFRWQRELSREVFTSADALEGARAFAEKRVPNWTGR